MTEYILARRLSSTPLVSEGKPFFALLLIEVGTDCKFLLWLHFSLLKVSGEHAENLRAEYLEWETTVGEFGSLYYTRRVRGKMKSRTTSERKRAE